MRDALVPALAISAVLSGAPALAQDNPACAKFQEPLAYNACLARLGPPAHATRAIAAPQGETEGSPAAGGRRIRGGLVVAHGKRGRMRLEFDVGPHGGSRLQ
jgi:hypothetical protein